MLVYIRESDKDNIICNVDEKDIAEHLRVSCWFYPYLELTMIQPSCQWSLGQMASSPCTRCGLRSQVQPRTGVLVVFSYKKKMTRATRDGMLELGLLTLRSSNWIKVGSFISWMISDEPLDLKWLGDWSNEPNESVVFCLGFAWEVNELQSEIVLCFFVLWKIPDDPLKWTNFKQSFLLFRVPFIYWIFFDQIALFWESGLITFIGLFQERLKKEQEEKEHKKKEKAEAHLYTIIKVGTSNATNFQA